MHWKLAAIDGFAKSGKTTLANQIARELANVHVVSMDDFFLPAEKQRVAMVAKKFDLERLFIQVLEPQLSGRAISYQRSDWGTGTLGSEFVEIPLGSRVIVDGTYSLHVNIREVYDFSVFVQTPESTRVKRFAELAPSIPGLNPTWDSEELLYLSSMDPSRFATLCVSGQVDFPSTEGLLDLAWSKKKRLAATGY